MSKTYKFNRSIFIIKYLAIIFFIISLAMMMINMFEFNLILILYAVICIGLLVAIYHMDALSHTVILSDDEQIIWQSQKKKQIIQYDEITHIHVARKYNLVSYLCIHANNGIIIKISNSIDNLDDLLRVIYHHLLDIDSYDLKNQELFDFYKASIEKKFQRQRLKKISTYLFLYIGLYVIFQLIIQNELYYHQIMKLFISYLLINFVSYTLIEYIFYSPKTYTITLKQYTNLTDQSKTSRLLFLIWIMTTSIHILLTYIIMA
jgi:hypothetical protein